MPSTEIKDFKLPSQNSPMRFRPAAHLADEKYIAKYNEAIRRMKALPDEDPLSFKQQANVHSAYCNGAYSQLGYPHCQVHIHNGWLFFPYHRYLEKILGMLLEDPTFAIPFWNWDNPPGMKMPDMFVEDPSSSLYDVFRNADHLREVVDLNYKVSNGTYPSPQESQESINLKTMYRQMVSNSKCAELFYGSAYRAGDCDERNCDSAGTLELIPHNTIHDWCGDPNQNGSKDMGNFATAARDSIFYSHHGNVDRMWIIWKNITTDHEKRRRLEDNNDWLDANFIFYDENRQPVRAYVKDCLDNEKLRYAYAEVDIPWIKEKPTPRKSNPNKVAPAVEFPFVLDRVISTVVARPSNSRRRDEKEEVLVIEGIEFEKDAMVKFDVHINDDEDSPCGPENTEFAGSFVHVRHFHTHGKKKMMNSALRLGITDLLKDLEADGDDTVLVTLVPQQGKGLVTISGIVIELLS